MDIYTGTGDDGETSLMDGSRVSKANPRINAYGSVDELNAVIGVALPTGYDDTDAVLQEVQNHLHIIQSELSEPSPEDAPVTIDPSHTKQVEAWIDEFDEELPPLDDFILPSGSREGSRLHHARTVSRRAERKIVRLAESAPVNEATVTYINRVSDLLFTLARVVNLRNGNQERTPEY